MIQGWKSRRLRLTAQRQPIFSRVLIKYTDQPMGAEIVSVELPQMRRSNGRKLKGGGGLLGLAAITLADCPVMDQGETERRLQRHARPLIEGE